MKTFPAVAVLLLVAIATVSAYPRFVEEIPNVPTVKGVVWRGVGHNDPAGGGARNVFGKAFDAAGYKWTPELCKADSDGDGFTNGQELGDPACTWVKGQPNPVPLKGMAISHPGLPDSVPSSP